MALCWSFDKLGPIARGVEDTALVLAALHGAHPDDPDSLDWPFAFRAHAGARGRRIGFVPTQFEEPTTSPGERAALDALRAIGAELVEVELPQAPLLTILLQIWVEAAAAFQELLLQGRLGELILQDDDAWPNEFRTAHLISAVDYVQMQRVRREIMERTAECFADLDAIVAPGIGHSFSFVTNATGHPALTLRSGFREDGTPVALTLHGQLYDEGTLCEIGLALERELGVWQRHPEFA
jgi:Asp-tRNA(Asn)/Glu-tRNA(Gln) amidotransferase A subunit family amidase